MHRQDIIICYITFTHGFPLVQSLLQLRSEYVSRKDKQDWQIIRGLLGFSVFFSFIDKFLITKPTRFLTEELILHPSKHFCTAVGIYTQLGLQSSFTRAVYGLGAPKWEITGHTYWHKSTKTSAQKLLPPGWHGAAVGSTVTSPQKVPGSYPNWSFPVLSLHVSHVPARDWSWRDSST